MGAREAPSKLRGTPVSLPPWWLERANRASEGQSLSELAEKLSRVAQRDPAWDRTTVSRFLKNENPTYELMLAFCALFEELLQPVFIADTYEEAHQLLVTTRRVRGSESTPEKEARRAVLIKAREQIEQSVADQTSRLESVDEGISNRRRTRGVGRSRTPSS
jgi:transcriptional regulator with XRE-family HTH domain